ncbi:2-oxoacid:ferredoxin oxidoreductase subunit beta [Isachenkonia alkalipeptolytica]|uniref:2-oxoacid:ferredoxin oxidoreductase subunit beta n=1 Tax=Isachenkonia alkalipeptolytica TaxID=2565777 RepID=A0AA44BDI7_9CLOT|nr:2-oxoacid:ferredoxin oxidoreductase subunit beta [Isachenkonia alkalipeptolytica]NBG87987.1 2-oxoacid:ferredoxin oxidoreductase subunit beta [Isachenkonia alkalipeptolytica]
MAKYKDYSNGIEPTWCKGCGDFSVLRSLQVATAEMEIPRKDLSVVSGIGCSGRISGYMKAYSFHGVHGRALPIAQGIKLANEDLTVIAAGGDGDGFAIGAGHFIHAAKRNINITYIVMNNQIYGLTKGHTSPVSDQGFKTPSTPQGSEDLPLQPGLMSLSAGATFLAQGFSGYQEELVDLIKKGIEHEGFSFINVFSPCITFNKQNTYQWFRKNLTSVSEDRAYDPSSYHGAMGKLMETNGLVTGVLYENQQKEKKKEMSLRETPMALEREEFQALFNRLY